MEKCTQRENAHLYSDGELSGPEAAAFEAHMKECPECASLVADMKALDNIFSAKERVEPGADTRAKVIAYARRESMKKSIVANGTAALSRRMALAAACLCLVLTMLLSFQLRPGTNSGIVESVATESTYSEQSQYLPGVELSENEVQILTGDEELALNGYYSSVFE